MLWLLKQSRNKNERVKVNYIEKKKDGWFRLKMVSTSARKIICST